MVFEFLPLQTCINSWAESLETPSHLCLGGLGAGTGDWHMENLYPKPVFQVLDRACFLQNSCGDKSRGREVGQGSQFGFSPSSPREIPLCPVPPVIA